MVSGCGNGLGLGLGGEGAKGRMYGLPPFGSAESTPVLHPPTDLNGFLWFPLVVFGKLALTLVGYGVLDRYFGYPNSNSSLHYLTSFKLQIISVQYRPGITRELSPAGSRNNELGAAMTTATPKPNCAATAAPRMGSRLSRGNTLQPHTAPHKLT